MNPPPTHYPPSGGYARQVPIIAVLIITTGALQVVTTIAGVIVFAVILANEPGNNEGAVVGMAFMGVFGLISVLSGVVMIVAGALNYRWKARIFGIIACAQSVLMAFMLCIPAVIVPIGLTVYCVIVYVNPEVTRGFEMGRQGMTRQQIAAALGIGYNRP